MIIDEIIRIARSEWEFFGKQEFDVAGHRVRRGKKETEDGFWERVGLYWREGADRRLDGRNTDQPWSAAFVSYVMKSAGAGGRFLYSGRHSDYIHEAIAARQAGRAAYGFWGFRLEERSPEVGDLICYAREPRVDFGTRRTRYKAHADIVVATSNGTIQVIGGNVSHSVSMKTLGVDAGGRLADSEYDWFAVLQNRLDLPPA